MSALLSAWDLTAERGDRTLFKDLSFSVSSGEVLHVIGPNGSGKTTLIRILAGLTNNGFRGGVSRDSSLLYVGHQAALKGQLTVLENLLLDLSGWSAPSTKSLNTVLKELKLDRFRDFFVNTLSAGQRRRVSLARIFLTEHLIWLLDEPFNTLDQYTISRIESRIQDHLRGGGAIVVSSHHDLNLPEAKIVTIDLEAG